jgi:NitT/TauT family transport system ATP-binding protein
MSAIKVTALSKRFSAADAPVVHNLTFTLEERQCLCLLGPSGCGKTTLLRLLMGLEKVSDGDITLSPGLIEHMSYVFQEPRLVPWRSCLENVLLPLELTHSSSAAQRDRAVALLQQLGLGERLAHFPSELSGGMQMRVALARALVTEPRIILLDEPFAALDERSRFRMQDLLLSFKAELGLQYVFVTHSIAEAVYLGDRILMMDAQGGQRDWRAIDFPARDQALKMTAEFNGIVESYSRLFTDMETALVESGGSG